ncbi:hypothetical protein PVAP13_8KG039302 [Panicum virgatum]|uniref:Uncharacterized protein n=1 Tax=Panicum virgatum TaxID=38727 RepID=A0A8T0PDI1_PANVG|nr:hypothetical protein PVAP13_8KG039302 [Panicum virgatum]
MHPPKSKRSLSGDSLPFSLLSIAPGRERDPLMSVPGRPLWCAWASPCARRAVPAGRPHVPGRRAGARHGLEPTGDAHESRRRASANQTTWTRAPPMIGRALVVPSPPTPPPRRACAPGEDTTQPSNTTTGSQSGWVEGWSPRATRHAPPPAAATAR